MSNDTKTHDAATPSPGTVCWAVVAYRWGWINSHQYIVRVTNDLQAAKDAADAEAMRRGGKYGVTVWDSDGKSVHHAPSSYGEENSHVNYRLQLFESVGQVVVVALEDGKPLTTEQITSKWQNEVKMKEIMERTDPRRPNTPEHRTGAAKGTNEQR